MKREPLGNDTILYTTDEYRFGTDAVLLADFANPKTKDKVCDLGCGGGIIPMLFCRDNKGREVYGIDIQKGACEIASAAAKENGFNNLQIINADLRELKGVVPFSQFNVVTCNPPYKKGGAGITNSNEARYIARHEAECTLADVCSAASKLLISSGRFCVCHRPERLSDIIDEMRRNKIEPKRLRTVHQREGLEPWLILVEGRRDGKSGMRIMPPLYIENNDGELSDEMKQIYGIYKFGESEGE